MMGFEMPEMSEASAALADAADGDPLVCALERLWHSYPPFNVAWGGIAAYRRALIKLDCPVAAIEEAIDEFVEHSADFPSVAQIVRRLRIGGAIPPAIE